MSVMFVWFIELSRSSVSLLIFCLVAPHVTEGGMSRPPASSAVQIFPSAVSVFTSYILRLFSHHAMSFSVFWNSSDLQYVLANVGIVVPGLFLLILA